MVIIPIFYLHLPVVFIRVFDSSLLEVFCDVVTCFTWYWVSLLDKVDKLEMSGLIGIVASLLTTRVQLFTLLFILPSYYKYKKMV